MVKSIEGVYRAGKVELLEPPPEGAEGRVIVTFLSVPAPVNLAERGIDAAQAADPVSYTHLTLPTIYSV